MPVKTWGEQKLKDLKKVKKKKEKLERRYDWNFLSALKYPLYFIVIFAVAFIVFKIITAIDFESIFQGPNPFWFNMMLWMIPIGIVWWFVVKMFSGPLRNY